MGERIQARRREAGLTQAGLGRELGVGQETVSRWEAGRVEIGTDDLRALGRVLQAHTGWFMEGEPPAGFMEPAKERLRVARDRPAKRGEGAGKRERA